MSIGLWPIDVDEPRPLNTVELVKYRKPNWPDLELWEPMVQSGTLVWRPRAQEDAT